MAIGDYVTARYPNAPRNYTQEWGSRLIQQLLLRDSAVRAGTYGGHKSLVKWGRADHGVQVTDTDIWDRADSTPTQQIWVAPTQARIHAIVSDNATDDEGNTGAEKIRVWGLTSWTTTEVYEDVTMNGTTPVNTTNSYVIIHRMRVIQSGGTTINTGTITATAATDGTITAVIKPNNGSTEMAIYGIPSIERVELMNVHAGILDSSGGATNSDALVELSVNREPTNQTTAFVKEYINGVQSNGTNSATWPFMPYIQIDGPAIIKLQAIASAADTDMVGGFSGIVTSIA